MSDNELEEGGEHELEGMQFGGVPGQKKKGNIMPVWGNEKTMNLNNMILTNIQQSPYYKVQLAEFKTYHEVVDQIYYHVNHLEPWERGSRKTSGQIGMCGGVRGVGAGGIVSSAFCLLFKLFAIKLTRKQLYGLLNHTDSPYLRGIGFLYIRFCQPPQDLWELLEPYLEDSEEVDPKAGNGDPQTIGQVVRHMLTRLDWYGTLFPRIPVPIQKQIEAKLKEHRNQLQNQRFQQQPRPEEGRAEPAKRESPQASGDKDARRRSRSPIRPREDRSRPAGSPDRRVRKDDRDFRNRDTSRRDERRGSPDRRRQQAGLRRVDTIDRAHTGESSRRNDQRDDGHRKREDDRPSGKGKSDDFSDLLEREKDRQRHSKLANESDRSKKTRSPSTGSIASSASSGTMRRRQKEETEKKHHRHHRPKEHRRSHDRTDRVATTGRDSKDRVKDSHVRKRSRSPTSDRAKPSRSPMSDRVKRH